MKQIALIASMMVALAAADVWADASDDTLKFYLSKSDCVALGTIVSEPHAIIMESGVLTYTCDFRISDVVKGEGGMKNRTIRVSIQRLEMDTKDRHPLLKKDSECILFLKNASPNVPQWVTADFWFGIQFPSPAMIRSLKRMDGESKR